MSTKNRKPSYYYLIGVVGLIAAVVGFWTTFFVPLAAGSFHAPVVIYVHGVFAFAWVILFLLQNVFVRTRNLTLHKQMGYFGAVVALGVAVTIIPAGLFQIERDLRNGMGPSAVSSIVGIFTSPALFLTLVIFGIVYRDQPQVHKRLMLLATLALLWPAWFRFRHYFPSIPRPDIWFGFVLADVFILLAWTWEFVLFKRVHPVLLFVGLFVIAEHFFEVMMFDRPGWRSFSGWIYGQIVAN